MSNTNNTMFGGITKVDAEGNEILSLTGSASVVEIGGLRVLIDIGLFQGGKGAEAFNATNVDFLKDIDAVIITHPHIDHVGRLPLLYKYGFRGPIYMTPASRKITIEMLKDSLKVEEQDREERLKRNNRLGFRLRDALKIKQALLSLKKNNISNGEEKQRLELFLIKRLGEGYNPQKSLKEMNEYLKFHKVKTENDIGKVIAELNETLYTEVEMEGVIGLIQSLEYTEEKIIGSKKVSSINKNTQNQEVLDSLPELVADGYLEKQVVNKKSEKRKLRAFWKEQLKENIKDVIKSNKDFTKLNNKLKKELETAFTFCENYDFLNKKTDPNRKDFKDPAYKLVKHDFKKYKKLLNKYNIKSRADIKRLIEDKEKLIDIFKIDIPFNSKDIEKAAHLVNIEKKGNDERHVTGITLTNPKHVVGSASINIISGIVRGQINNIVDIDTDGNAISEHFSGDLGRMKDNRLGKPELPAFPINYIQIESTYATKEHRNRAESVKDLVDSIEQLKGNVLISSFAQHRLQEILMTLLEEKQKNPDILNNEILIDAPLGERLTNLYIEFEGEVFDLLTEEAQKEIFGKVVFRFLEEDEWAKIYDEQEDKEYDIRNKIEDANIGKPKEIIDKLVNEALKKERSKNKYIILASSGMMEGGAIMNHLPHILENPDATLLAPGYLGEGTLGNKIVIADDKIVTVNKKQYEVKCNKKFVDGFSSHISHSEILQYITACLRKEKFKLDSTIALNHGVREKQKILKKDIESLLKEFDRTDIKVTIPEMFEEYDIDTRKVNKKKTTKNKKAFTVLKEKPECVTPKCLLGPESEAAIPKDSEEVIALRGKNERKITNTINYLVKNVGKILKNKKILIKDFLISKINDFRSSELFAFIGKVGKLGEWQKKEFYSIIDKKLEANKWLKGNISVLSNKIKNIDIIYDIISDFKYNIDYVFVKEIESYQEEIDQINNNEIICDLQSSRRRIRYLKSKIKELNLIITGDTSLLEKEIEGVKISITKTREKFRKFKEEEFKKGNKKNKENRVERESYKNKIIVKKKRITDLEAKILKIKNKRINFETRLKSNVPERLHDRLSGILKKMWEGDCNSLDNLRKLCDDSKLELDSRITIQLGELESDININLRQREQVFGGRNLYKEIFGSNRFDLEKLESLIKEDLFSGADKNYIEQCLEEYKKSNQSKPIIRLKKFFKNKQSINNDLGQDLSVSIEELHKEALRILKEIFRGDYFEKNIVPQFDIYLFLKSKEPFYKYIKKKFNLEKLKGYRKYFSETEKVVKEVDFYYKEDLARILENNTDASDIESLEQIEYGIENLIAAIREQIGKVTESEKQEEKNKYENKKKRKK